MSALGRNRTFARAFLNREELRFFASVHTVQHLTHLWQAQRRGKLYLPLMRHPFCRYDYAVRPGWKFERYGLEQQAEIVRHVHLLRNGHRFPGTPPLEQLESILPF